MIERGRQEGAGMGGCRVLEDVVPGDGSMRRWQEAAAGGGSVAREGRREGMEWQ